MSLSKVKIIKLSQLTLFFALFVAITSCSSSKTSNTPPPGNNPSCGNPPTINIIPDPQTGYRSQFIQKFTGENEILCDGLWGNGKCTTNLTVNQTETFAGLKGTDLGTSFKYKGDLWFLFGDTVASENNGNIENYPTCPNSMAKGAGQNPQGLFLINFLLYSGLSEPAFYEPRIQGVNLNCFDVPLDGIEGSGSNPLMYIWFSDDNGGLTGPEKQFYKSLLAKSTDNAQSFTYLYDFSHSNDCRNEDGTLIKECTVEEGRFVYLTAEITNNGPDDHLYIFGSGKYRGDDVYLSTTKLSDIEDRNSFSYFTGLDPSCIPRWSSNELDAVAVIDTPEGISDQGAPLKGCVGELSVTFNKVLGFWLALYNCGNQIMLNVAENPWGPWSASQVIFDPAVDGGYCNFIYKSGANCPQLDDYCNKLSGCGTGPNGGVYGPYVINRFTQSDGQGGAFIYYVMSTWNPYNTVIMRTHLQPDI